MTAARSAEMTAALGGWLDEVDEVAAGVFEKDGSDGAHGFWFATKNDTERFQAGVFRGDVAGEEGRGGNSCGEESFLKGLRGWETHGLEDELDAFGAFGGCDSEPTEGWTHRDVLAFYEAEFGGVEAETGVLVFDHDAGKADLHGWLLCDLGLSGGYRWGTL